MQLADDDRRLHRQPLLSREWPVAYGFIPVELTTAQEHDVHGINERIEVKDLGNGIRRMVELLRFVGGSEKRG